MLNSNFDLRTFLAESKNPTLSEGAKFKVGDMVKLSGGEPTEVLAVRKMTGSDLHAYSIKNSKGERAEYDETQLTAADVNEGEYKDKGQSAELNKERLQALKAKKAEMEKKGVPAGLIATVDKQIGELEKLVSEVLSEATVMEYIRERMTEMNNEVRSCMREYLTAVNEIDPGHEDAHAQLMGALEDFYNKLKAHFEADAMEDPMPGDEEPPTVLPSDTPSRELDGSPMIEGEEEEEAFGGEEDELEEKVGKFTSSDKDEYIGDDGEKEDEEYLKYLKSGGKVGLPGMGIQTKHLTGEDELEEETYTAQDGNEYKASYNLYVKGEKVANFEDKEKAQEELKKYQDKYGDRSDIVIKPAHDPVNEEAVNEAIDSETVDLLMGLAKSAVTMGTVPAALAVLYQFKDHPKIAKVVTAFEKHLDK